MPRRTPKERVDAALAKRGLSPPADFKPEPGPIHENLQRAFACELGRDGPLAGKFGGREIWSYDPGLGNVENTRRPWVSLGHYDGGNYTIFTYDFGAADPPIYVFDHHDFDERAGGPRHATRLTASLSAFLRGLRPEAMPRKAPSRAPGSPIASTVAIEFDFEPESIALANDALLVAANGRLVITDLGGPTPVQFSASLRGSPMRGAIDGQDAIVIADDESFTWCRRKQGGDWTQPRRVRLEQPGFIHSLAVADGILALGQYGEGRALVYERTSRGWAFQHAIGSFGQSVAVWGDWLAAGGWNAFGLYQRKGSTWQEVKCPPLGPFFPGDGTHGAEGLALGDGIIVVAETDDGMHLQDGRFTGQERRESGTLFVYERDDDGRWQGPSVLKRENPQNDERLGYWIACTRDRIVTTTDHRLHERQRPFVFVRDEAGHWRQALEHADVPADHHRSGVAVATQAFATHPRGSSTVTVYRLAEVIAPPVVPAEPARGPVPVISLFWPQPAADSHHGSFGFGHVIAAGGALGSGHRSRGAGDLRASR